MANVSSFSGAMPVIPGGLVELGYTERTTDFSTTQTAFSTTAANNVFASDLSVVCDGGPILVEFFARITANTSSTAYGQFALNLDGAENARCATSYGSANDKHIYFQRRISPSAGVHTFNVCPYSSAANTLYVYAGAGGVGTSAPAFLRVSKIVNQNDGLKPFWTPPVVTSLPSQATVGDQVIYAADATNGVYWHLQYDGLGTYPWKFIGGSELRDYIGANESRAVNSYAALSTAGPSVAIPLPGDYDVTLVSEIYSTSTGAGVMSYDIGSTAASDDWGVYSQTYGPGYQNTVSVTRRQTALTAVTLTSKYKSPAAVTVNFLKREMRVRPIRVKAA